MYKDVLLLTYFENLFETLDQWDKAAMRECIKLSLVIDLWRTDAKKYGTTCVGDHRDVTEILVKNNNNGVKLQCIYLSHDVP